MVRKVGFDTGEDRKSVADRVLDEHRAKARAKDAVAKQAEMEELAREAARPKRQWFPIIFLTVWLTGWSGAIYAVISVILSGERDGGLYLWLGFAIIGWLMAVFFLVMLIRNK